jgi:hypothetical protein
MAYYIFLKSLRSLEEFRKNPHAKIPPKSPSTNFQSLDKFKNPILIQNSFFFDFQPGRPRGPLGLWPSQPTGRAAPRRPKAPGRPVQPARRSRLLGKYVFLFGSRLPEPAASSPCHRHVGPTCRLHRLHRASRPRRELSAPPLPASPAPRLGCRQAFTTPPPHHFPP